MKAEAEAEPVQERAGDSGGVRRGKATESTEATEGRRRRERGKVIRLVLAE
jgi:hypothetical protein